MCLTAFVCLIEYDNYHGKLSFVTFLNNIFIGSIFVHQLLIEHLQWSQVSPYPQGILAAIIGVQIYLYFK